MPLFRCLTYSNNEITEITKTPIINQVKVVVNSEFVLSGEVELGVRVKVGDEVGVTDEELAGMVTVLVLLQLLFCPSNTQGNISNGG